MTKANTASPKKSLEIPSVTHRFFVALQRAYAKIFKIQKNLCAFFDQTASDKACAHDKRTKREKERPERATSPQAQGNALGYELVGLSARTGPQTELFRTFSTYLFFLDFDHP